ncbi:DUF951 domain-containing protein [Jeotgalibaca sp. MA1X17-3]|uniref:DUF951 domain-containing protein n=1 Tax=Jeotgalibaca sp. MA1X17-3 TaxID=2908211 RepID=UPI001F3CA00D|nr:DUF951 domain-containing protein [Jeotgalibaca sp. MA1X17-3]UJF15846.1 DUF951 domain-containing protein [Jeotgalibaca sp. MA1X17-3]
MVLKEYELHDVVEMKKPHPCKSNSWEIIRMGMDIRIKCQKCGQMVLMPRREFEKKMKKVLIKAERSESNE